MSKILSVLFVAMLALATPALAEKTPVLPTEYTIEMWNQDPDDRQRRMVFSEELVTVAEGATVTWVATDRGHNVEFVYGPDGVELPGKSKLGADYTFTFDTAGVYVYVCSPHVSMGMIGVVIVGEATAEQIAAAINDAKIRGAGKKKLEALLSN
jgi:pseudoazurin